MDKIKAIFMKKGVYNTIFTFFICFVVLDLAVVSGLTIGFFMNGWDGVRQRILIAGTVDLVMVDGNETELPPPTKILNCDELIQQNVESVQESYEAFFLLIIILYFGTKGSYMLQKHIKKKIQIVIVKGKSEN